MMFIMSRIYNDKVTSGFFIIGLCISILLLSVGISFSYEHLYAGNIKKKNTPPNGELFVISGQSDKTLNSNEFEILFKGINKNSGIIFNGLMIHPDSAKINSYYPVSAEWFSRDDVWHYPIKAGHYFKVKDIKNKNKVALVGSSLEECIKKVNNKEYIILNKEKYEVVGMIGVKGKMTLWDNRIVLPITVIPDNLTEELALSEDSINLILYNIKGLGNTKHIIEKNGKKIDSDFSIESQGKVKTENMLNELAQNQNPIYALAILGYLVTLIYSINIVIFWIEKRRYEIGVRKAFGYTDKDIAILLFNEIFQLTLIAAFLAIIIQFLAEKTISRISDYTLEIYLPNILLSILMVFITAVIISVCPVIKAMKIHPIETIKEGERH